MQACSSAFCSTPRTAGGERWTYGGRTWYGLYKIPDVFNRRGRGWPWFVVVVCSIESTHEPWRSNDMHDKNKPSVVEVDGNGVHHTRYAVCTLLCSSARARCGVRTRYITLRDHKTFFVGEAHCHLQLRPSPKTEQCLQET